MLFTTCLQNLSAQQVQNYLSELQSNWNSLGLKGAIILVDPQYLILMLNTSSLKKAQALDAALNALESNTDLTKLDHIIFSNQKYKSTQIEPGSGISVQFNEKLKPQSEIMAPMLNSLKPQFKVIGGQCERIFQ